MIGRTSPTLGRHTRFFTTQESAVAFASEQLVGIAMSSPVTHATLSGVRISAAATSPIRLMSEGVEPAAVTLPASLTGMVAASVPMVAHVERPSLGITLRETAFTRVWQAYMPGDVIPYDRRARRRRLHAAYRDLAPYIAKWERLHDLGPQDLSRRFDRNPRQSERL